MEFKLWLESEEIKNIVDSRKMTSEDQRVFGNSAVVEDGYLIGYHVTDDPEKPIDVIKSSKKLTATYGKGRSRFAELGPGLYVSGIPDFWKNRSVSKWDFLKNLTNDQRQALADKIRNDRALVGIKQSDGQIWKYVSDYEREHAERDINLWLSSGHDPIIVNLAGQPYNIAFWKPEYLEPLGIKAAAKKPLMEIKFTGKFVNLSNHVQDFTYIARCIRQGLDGGFNPGGISSNAELCIWRKECIINYGLE